MSSGVSNIFNPSDIDAFEATFKERRWEEGTWFLRPSTRKEGCFVITYSLGEKKVKCKRLKEGLSNVDSVLKEVFQDLEPKPLCRLIGIENYPLRSQCGYTIKHKNSSDLFDTIQETWKGEPKAFLLQEKSIVTPYPSRLLKMLGERLEGVFEDLFGCGLEDFNTQFEEFVVNGSHWSVGLEKRFQAEYECEILANFRAQLLDLSRKTKKRFISKKQIRAKELILDWFQKDDAQGIFLGESHYNTYLTTLLVKEMVRLKKEGGVTTLFLEFLPYDALQDLLDNSLGEALPFEVEVFLSGYDAGFYRSGRGLLEVVKAAREAGVRVVGLETDFSADAGFGRYGAEGDKRMIGLNYTAYSIIEKEKGDGKYVALMGSAHVSTHEGIPGMSEITGEPNLVVMQAWDVEKKALAFRVLYKQEAHFDALLTLPIKKK